jgi:cytochrome c biogenesis protein CcdA
MQAILSLFSGVLAIFSPSVIVMLMISMIALSKITTGTKDGKYLPILFCIFFVVFYLVLSLLIAQNRFEHVSPVLIYSSIGLLFLIGVFITGVFQLLFPEKKLNYPSKLGLLFLMSFLFFSVSISSTGPVLGTILMKADSGGDSIFIISILVSFAIGLVIPVYLWLLFWVKHMAAFTSKGWWKYVELVSGSCLILVSMVEFYFTITV